MRWFWRVFKVLRWVLYGVLSIVILVLGVVTAIVATEPGSRWALNQAAERLPLTFEGMQGNLITGLDLDWVEYHLEEQHYRVESLSFRWQPLALLYSAVSVQSLRASAVEAHLPPPAEDAEAEPEVPTEWPSLALPVRIELGGVDLRNIRIHQEKSVTELYGVSGTLSYGTFNLRVWDLSVVGPEFELGLNGRTGLSYPYDSNLALRWRYTLTDIGGQPMTFRGEADIDGDLSSVSAEHRLTSPATLSSEVRFWPNLNDPDSEPQLVFDTSWPSQLLPPALFPQSWPTVETSGRLQLDGWLNDYHLEMAASGQAQGFPKLDVRAKGLGSLEHLELENLSADLPEGNLDATGSLRWTPEVQWDLGLTFEEINPASLPLAALTDWPGQLGGQLNTQGKMTESGPDIRVENLTIGGHLRALAVLLQGETDYQGERLHTQGLNFNLGANQLRIEGSLAEKTLDFQGRLDAPILSQLDPALNGELAADLQLSGPLSEPEGRINLTGRELRWQDYKLAQLELALTRSGQNLTLNLASEDLDLAGQTLSKVSLEGSGDVDQHEVSAEVHSTDWGQAAWTMAGGYQTGRWEGAMTKLLLEPDDPLLWELAKDASMILSAEEIVVQSLCLNPWPRWQRRDGERPDRPAEGRICVDGQWQPGGGASALALVEGLPLRLAQRWLQPDVSLDGSLEGRLEFKMPPQTSPTAKLHLETRDGALRYEFGEDDAEVYPWKSTRLDAEWQDQQISADFASDWGEVGQLSAEALWATDSGELDGELRARLDSLTPIEAFVPQLQEVGGRLNGQMALAGTLSDPELTGEFALREGTAKLPEAGLDLKSITVTARGEPAQVSMEGSVDSGEGQLQLEGGVDNPWSPDRQIRARLTGENFQALNTRELQVLLTPDLTLAMNRERIDLTGDALIPKALARFKTLPESATRTSNDVVIKDPNGNGDDQERAELHVDLNLALGDDVRFEGFGLESRLSGELQVIQNPERGLLTVGEVGVAEGRYKAYGQDLDIERGRLIFQGPYDNPGLDIRATREADDVTAGLEIGGTLQRPRSRVFSSPSLPDSEAMAILLTGKSLSSSSSADASMLVNAIGGLGLERSGFITAEIADTFSLDEFRIQTEDDVTESSLYIGKYLTPKLFVRYVVGLFDQTNSIGLRYELTEGLRLEAESGITQSVDMIYKFER